MPRELILIPPKQTVFRNAEPIGQGYPRQNTYTQQQMREWAQDASEVEQITREDRNLPGVSDAWICCSPSLLPS